MATPEDGTGDPDGILGAVASAVGSPTPVWLNPRGPVLVPTLADARAVLKDVRRFPIPFDASRRPLADLGAAQSDGRPDKPTTSLAPDAVAAGRAVFVAELASAWPPAPADLGEITVHTLDLLRLPVSRSTTAALVPAADHATRDRIAELTLAWVDALAPVISAARPPRRWSAERRREQRALRDLRAALAEVGVSASSAMATALAAGVQVPIAAGAWVLQQLAAHPDVADEAVTDQRLRLAIVWETLRLYPPTWLLPRIALSESVIGGVTLPAYTPLVVSPRALGQLDEVAPGPESGFKPLTDFDPTRWCDDTARPGAWLPFGAGPHACPGRNLALAQLVHLVERGVGQHLRSPGPVRIDASRGLRPSPARVVLGG
ncbi:cytochrome P450 [Nocardioides sp. LS1]|uniref:cytochrome P450 n=1 Tax=Nocardioides sp. LS1 TaxID=1027620 RepID=UPI00163A87F9|nr:cytochrome P450 [Nocardioides sp. LS1]